MATNPLVGAIIVSDGVVVAEGWHARYGDAHAEIMALRAAADPSAQNGQYFGPGGFGEQKGHPKVVASSAQSHDEDIQRRLWTVSEELTGVTYPV